MKEHTHRASYWRNRNKASKLEHMKAHGMEMERETPHAMLDEEHDGLHDPDGGLMGLVRYVSERNRVRPKR